MISVEYNYYLPVPPAAAFAYLANPGRNHEWQSSCLASRLHADQPAPGCRYDITFLFLTRRMEFLGEICEFEPNNRAAFRILEGPFYYDDNYRFEPEGDGIHVYWRFNADPKGFFGIIPASILRKVMLSQVEKDVAALKTAFAGRTEPVFAR